MVSPLLRKTILLLTCALLAIGLAAVVNAQTPGTTPLCADIGAGTNPIVKSGGGFCNIIAASGQYGVGHNGGDIGNDAILNLGVIHAVDISHFVNGQYATQFEGPIQVCLRGEGTLFFLSVRNMPRVEERIQYYFDGEYTCGYILDTGTLVLTPSTGPAPLPVPGTAPVTTTTTTVTNPDGTTTTTTAAGGLVPAINPETGEPRSIQSEDAAGAIILTGCRVRMNNRVNLRMAPSITGEVIDILPFDLTLQATQRVPEWFRVVYLDGQAWVSATYVDTLSSACDGGAAAAPILPTSAAPAEPTNAAPTA
jgi:hypothetical protein